MQENLGDWIVGILVSVLGLAGLFLWAGAQDVEMTIFGLALAGFAVVFVIGLIKRHYDEKDTVHATAKARVNPHG